MTIKQEAIAAMAKRVSAFFKKHTRDYAHISALAPLVVLIDMCIEKIDFLKQIQGTDITGLAQQKQTLREKATQWALQVSRGIVAYAKLNNDKALAQEMFYNDSDLTRLSDNQFDTALRVIDNSLNLYSDKIVACGITEQMVTNYKAAKVAYADYTTLPQQGTKERKQATTQIGVETDSILSTVEKIDLLMDTTRYESPALFAEYADNRKIVVRAGTIAAKIRVSDAVSKEAINGAHVAVMLDEEIIVEKITAKSGVLHIKTLNENNYLVIVSKIGYKTVQIPMEISDSDSNLLDVQLEK